MIIPLILLAACDPSVNKMSLFSEILLLIRSEKEVAKSGTRHQQTPADTRRHQEAPGGTRRHQALQHLLLSSPLFNSKHDDASLITLCCCNHASLFKLLHQVFWHCFHSYIIPCKKNTDFIVSKVGPDSCSISCLGYELGHLVIQWCTRRWLPCIVGTCCWWEVAIDSYSECVVLVISYLKLSSSLSLPEWGQCWKWKLLFLVNFLHSFMDKNVFVYCPVIYN
jgi:hypothetical protein